MWQNGNSKGCGYRNRTYMQYQSKRSGFPQYQSQIGTMVARDMQTDRRERLPQIQETATS